MWIIGSRNFLQEREHTDKFGKSKYVLASDHREDKVQVLVHLSEHRTSGKSALCELKFLTYVVRFFSEIRLRRVK